jgi:spore maturation protein SpmB
MISFGLTQVIVFIAVGQTSYTGGLTAVLEAVSPWVIPMVLLTMLSYGLAVQLLDKLRGVEPRLEIYPSFIDGAKEGFGVALKIIPYLVAILVAVGMFRASGALDMLTRGISPILGPLGMPAEALPMALLRPLSGSGAFGYMTEVVNTNGPDSYLGYLVTTMQGSTETTFYVVAVYFGAVQVNKLRHTIPACLTADLVGVVATVLICSVLFGALT